MLRNIGSTWAVTLVSIAVTYVLTPFVIHALGGEGYGTWTLITALTGYINLLALGIPMACVRYLTADVATGDARQMNRVIGSCAGLYLMMGAVALVVGAALGALFHAYRIPPVFQRQAGLAYGLMVFQVSAGFIGLLPEGIFFAHLAFETDALVIGAFIGVGAVPFYVVANSLIVYLMDFVVAIAAVVSPMATKLSTEGRMDELREIFLKWSKVALSLSLLAGLFLIVLGPRFIAQWIDPSFERPAGQVLQILMVSSLLFLPVRGVALPILMGLGKPKAPTIAFLVAGGLNLLISVVLARPLGLAGVALGTAIPNALFALFALVLACRELGITVPHYTRYVVPRATLGCLPVLALLLWFKLGLQVRDMTGLVTAGSAMVVLFAGTWVFYVYRHDPYVDLRTPMTRLRAWRNRA